MKHDDTTSVAKAAVPTGSLRAADFRLHALDIDPDLAASVKGAALNPGGHWILHDPNYQSIMTDLVFTVRGMQRAADTADVRSDARIAVDLLKAMRLWDSTQPTARWDQTLFIVRFLVAFPRLYWPLMAQAGLARGRRTRQKLLAAFG
jgi:hypothetical protein